MLEVRDLSVFERPIRSINGFVGLIGLVLRGLMISGFAGSLDNDIRVCVHPDYQGKGIGKVLITELMERFPDSFAKVKIENEASRNLFESCGFQIKYWLMEK